MLNIIKRYYFIFIFILPFILAVMAMAFDSIFLSIIYILFCISSLIMIIYTFCKKCQKKDKCKLYIPTNLVKLLPERTSFNYKRYDYLFLYLFFLIILTIPQYWICKNIYLTLIFWFFCLLTYVKVCKGNCKGCNHKYKNSEF